MNNFFEITANGKTYKSHNAVKMAFDYWVMRYAYASYIAVLGEGKRFDKRAEVVSYNDNVNNGALYATYRISISESEFPYEITSIGFAPFSGAPLSNECSVSVKPPYTEIYGTIYLEENVKDFTFYPGENPLVRSLLGMQTAGDIKVRARKAKLANRSAAVNPDEYDELNSVSYMDGESLVIAFDSGDKSDFLLMNSSLPCARFNLAYFSAEQNEIRVNFNGGAIAENSISVSDVKKEEAHVDFGAHTIVSALYFSGKEIMSGFDGYKLINDPTFSYAALVNGKDYYLIDGNILEVQKGGNYVGEIMLCANGDVVTASEGKITFGNGREAMVPKGQTQVLFWDDGYDIFVLTSDKLYIYRFQTELELKHTVSITGKLFRANAYAVIVIGDGKRLFTADGEKSFFGALQGIECETVSDGCYYGNGYMGSFVNGDRIKCEKFYGRFCVSGGNLFYVGESGATDLSKAFDFDGAALAGDAAIFINNGKLTFYRIGGDSVYVSANMSGVADITAKQWGKESGYVTLRIKE